MTRSLVQPCLLMALLGVFGACGDDRAGQCRIAADCPSGSCGPDGQCNTEGAADGGGGELDAAADAPISACGSQLDGILTRDELPLEAGVAASFRVAKDVSFDTAGQLEGETRVWDLDRPLAGDQDIEVQLISPEGAWYRDSFPSASYVTALSTDSDLLGVFELRDQGLYLLGVVSPEDGLTRTELSYEPAVLLVPLPLSEGDSWSTETDVSGVASGVISVYSESYGGQADAHGQLLTPFGRFSVLRTRMDLERTVGLLTTTTRQFNFVSECAGIVATTLSQDDEESIEYTSAAEIRRLIP